MDFVAVSCRGEDFWFIFVSASVSASARVSGSVSGSVSFSGICFVDGLW